MDEEAAFCRPGSNGPDGEKAMIVRIALASALVATLSLAATPGFAGDDAVHRGAWPIYDGRDHQPTQQELNADHLQDLPPNRAREIDKLYDQLMSSSEKILKEHPALKP
jgi:hypothetical protein